MLDLSLLPNQMSLMLLQIFRDSKEIDLIFLYSIIIPL